MADTEILPDWAARYVQEQLSDHMHIINVLPIDKGARAGAYLLNTSKGAVLVQKGRLSEISHWFMPLPGPHISFGCQRCQERMELVDPEVPRVVYCSSCGQRHYLIVQDGELAVVEEEQPPAAPANGGHVHEGYTLYLRKNGKQSHYFFAKSKPRAGKPTALPKGAKVELNKRTGVPMLVLPELRCDAKMANGKRCKAAAKPGAAQCGRHGG